MYFGLDLCMYCNSSNSSNGYFNCKQNNSGKNRLFKKRLKHKYFKSLFKLVLIIKYQLVSI